MRLIDADAFKEFIIDHFPYRPSDGECMAYEDVLRMLSDEHAAPTIEAEPVKHGRWVSSGLGMNWKAKDECGNCGFHTKDRRDLSSYFYCPNCGAKMDGDAHV